MHQQLRYQINITGRATAAHTLVTSFEVTAGSRWMLMKPGPEISFFNASWQAQNIRLANVADERERRQVRDDAGGNVFRAGLGCDQVHHLEGRRALVGRLAVGLRRSRPRHCACCANHVVARNVGVHGDAGVGAANGGREEL